MVCGNDIHAQHMAGEPRITLQNGLTDTHSCLTNSARRRSSVTVNPLQHERTVAESGNIDIPSTAWCVQCGNDIHAHHMAGEQLTTLQNGLTDTPSCLTHSVRRRSSVTVNPLQHVRTVAKSGSIDIPSTAWCVATISMLIIWQGSRAQPSRTV